MDIIMNYKMFVHDSLGVVEIKTIQQKQIRFIDGYLRISFLEIDNITINRIKSSSFATFYAGENGRWLYRVDAFFKVHYKEFLRTFDEPVVSLYFKIRITR